MKSKWKVSNNPTMGDTPYIVYRIRDISEIDHSGNREYFGGYFADKIAALMLASELNSKEDENGR